MRTETGSVLWKIQFVPGSTVSYFRIAKENGHFVQRVQLFSGSTDVRSSTAFRQFPLQRSLNPCSADRSKSVPTRK